jgi:hypothetical protein
MYEWWKLWEAWRCMRYRHHHTHPPHSHLGVNCEHSTSSSFIHQIIHSLWWIGVVAWLVVTDSIMLWCQHVCCCACRQQVWGGVVAAALLSSTLTSQLQEQQRRGAAARLIAAFYKCSLLRRRQQQLAEKVLRVREAVVTACTAIVAAMLVGVAWWPAPAACNVPTCRTGL